MIPPSLAFLAWIPVSLYIFHRYPVRIALLVNFVGGWAVLPGARYVASTTQLPYWILPVSLPSPYFFTKATIPALTALLGVLWADRRAFGRFQLTFWDLPMVMWCAVPILSGIANPWVLGEGLRGAIYQGLAWGVPYFFGRIYFSSTESLRLAAIAFVTAGLAYIPICVVEFFTGPQIYAHLYGYQPYRWIRAMRYIGYRPIGLLENGTQLGIWMGTAALIAGWLWKRHFVDRILGIPIGLAAPALLGVTLLCQSGESIVLLLCLMPFVFVSQRYLPRVATVLVVLAILTFAGVRLTNLVSLKTLTQNNRSVQEATRFLQDIKRGSLNWRLSLDEEHVDTALNHPVLGSGEWDWWRDGPARPWGLWMLSFGMYGMIGLVALGTLQLLPVARVVWFPIARSDIQAFHLRHALAAAILMSAIDNLFNSSMILPLLLVMGGMSTWTSATSVIPVDIRRKAGSESEVLGAAVRRDPLHSDY